MLRDELTTQIMQPYPNAKICFATEPQFGSILNGAKVLFSMPQFETDMCVSRKEWEYDDKIVFKKFF
jgi:hypothetical protein